MKDIEKMLKCRALFLQSIAYMTGSNLKMDEAFNDLLEGFMENYLEDNYDKFNLIYYFSSDEEGNLTFVEEPVWFEEMNKYLKYFKDGDNDKVIKLYDDIGPEDVDKISYLTELFWMYVTILNDMGRSKIKS